jgi:predicted nucleic acid-binding Zn ribbon protein
MRKERMNDKNKWLWYLFLALILLMFLLDAVLR